MANFRLPSEFAMDRNGGNHLVRDPDYTVDALKPPIQPGVVRMEDNSASVDQRRTLLNLCCLQALQLLAVKVRIERLAIGEQLIVDDSLPIPPNTQKSFPGRQSRLGHRLGCFTAFRPRRFARYVVVSDPLFIASHHRRGNEEYVYKLCFLL